MSFENNEKAWDAPKAWETLKAWDVPKARKTQESKERATKLMEDMDRLLTEVGLSHRRFKDNFGYQHIYLPDCDHTDECQYSIICHPYSYGYPDALEVGWRTGNGGIDVEGWLSPEEVIRFIQEHSKPKEGETK